MRRRSVLRRRPTKDRRGRNQRKGIPLRLFIALGIVLFSIISFYSMGQVNPITGNTQRVAISTDQEIALGLQAAPQMMQQHGGLASDAQGQRRVDQLGGELLTALNDMISNADGENPFQFEFHLLEDKELVNAFALPGGQVFITNALYERLSTDGQLAGVLGHEIGHVLERHGAQRLAQQKLTQGLAGAAGVASDSQSGAQIAAAVGQMVNMKYGRDAELESDKWGVRLTAAAGYDPRAMIQVMHVLEEASGPGGQPELFSTHPKPANRRKYIEDVIRLVFPKGMPDGLRE